ncbi:hypothetical protein GCK72_005776 [Caenorhabditis remanei]|uniref:SGNH hydrolase-type esterase domain-containing protein n=1 Tax=Caenorhabditis remanei TaxID=31234 RepID=E3MMU6_CAERE|nr:hypothetical protein GCK72_005776 [Caenorhabditis remanei]EFP05127.1 hypothetical protein CRE_04030 [Caenorhabditis remanei]KAF1765823.1 hypothetical protein GCK72_005776 [Caenorhabditis remanei]
MRSLLIVLIFSTFFATLETRILHRPRDFRCGRLIVFGDSLSDDGVEAEGESHGFLRNCNGKVWPEYVNAMLECDRYVNYAYSGAKSGIGNFYFDSFSGIQWQINQFLSNNKFLSDDPLVILQTGGTIDFFGGDTNSTEVVENIQQTIQNITQTMSSGTLVILSLLDVSNSPGVQAAEDSEILQERLGHLISETNRQLHHIVLDSDLGTRRLNPFLRVRLIDINTVALAAMQSLNTTEPFTHHSPDLIPQAIYKYAYHDLWNPSTIVHYHIAKEIVRNLQQF